jgi:indolepyruvate ferredoxin oxidoreductase alpha subunit
MLPPFSTADFLFCMGSSVSSGCGFARASGKPVVAFIGDSTFFHSGVTGLINAVFNKHDLLLVILDNGTTAMTGHQPNPAFPQEALGEDALHVDIETVVKGCGVSRVAKVGGYNLKSLQKALTEMKEEKGVRVLIVEELCILFARRVLRKKHTQRAYVAQQDDSTRACLTSLACPAFSSEGDVIRIDQDSCTGCMVCLQLSPSIKAQKGGA